MSTVTVDRHAGTPDSMRAWERAEIERSDVEASLSAERSLAVSARTWTRYANPPADTAYPLEYAYHQLGDVQGRTVLDFGKFLAVLGDAFAQVKLAIREDLSRLPYTFAIGVAQK